MSKTKKFIFVYITTNLINGKQYVGEHSTNNLNDGYIGGGRPYFQNAIKKHGYENFKREILEYFDTKQEAFNAQEKYIKLYNTLLPNGYNLSPTGGVGCVGCFSKETRKHFSDIAKGEKNAMYGKHHSIETLQKIRNKAIGRKASIETRKKMSNHRKKEKNSFFGKKHTKYSLDLISKNRKGKCVGEKNTSAKTFIFINPENISFIVSGNFGNFCQEHILSIGKMKRYINKGKIPLLKNDKHNMLTTESKNCCGWEIICSNTGNFAVA